MLVIGNILYMDNFVLHCRPAMKAQMHFISLKESELGSELSTGFSRMSISTFNRHEGSIQLLNILSDNEKLPASKLQYFGKYIIQLSGYWYVHVSGQRQTGLERLNSYTSHYYDARDARAFYVFRSFKII